MRQTDITAREARDRGYNLMITALVIIGGLAFGIPAFREAETADKLDDFALLGVAVLIFIWYRVGRQRFQRSLVPLGLVVLAIATQLYGVFVERDDTSAVGDNANALFVFVPVLLVAIWEYIRPLRLAQSEAGS
jgi:hypothetical protein